MLKGQVCTNIFVHNVRRVFNSRSRAEFSVKDHRLHRAIERFEIIKRRLSIRHRRAVRYREWNFPVLSIIVIKDIIDSLVSSSSRAIRSHARPKGCCIPRGVQRSVPFPSQFTDESRTFFRGEGIERWMRDIRLPVQNLVAARL